MKFVAHQYKSDNGWLTEPFFTKQMIATINTTDGNTCKQVEPRLKKEEKNKIAGDLQKYEVEIWCSL